VLTAERHYPERRYAVSRGSTTGSWIFLIVSFFCGKLGPIQF
jgi:hypothetical protein